MEEFTSNRPNVVKPVCWIDIIQSQKTCKTKSDVSELVTSYMYLKWCIILFLNSCQKDTLNEMLVPVKDLYVISILLFIWIENWKFNNLCYLDCRVGNNFWDMLLHSSRWWRCRINHVNHKHDYIKSQEMIFCLIQCDVGYIQFLEWNLMNCWKAFSKWWIHNWCKHMDHVLVIVLNHELIVRRWGYHQSVSSTYHVKQHLPVHPHMNCHNTFWCLRHVCNCSTTQVTAVCYKPEILFLFYMFLCITKLRCIPKLSTYTFFVIIKQ